MQLALVILLGLAAPSRPAIDVRFDRTTIAFYERVMHSPDDLPTVEDDRPCTADGTAWPDGERAVLAAFDAARARDPHFARWRLPDPLRVAHAAAARWLDAELAIHRRRHEAAIDLAVRVTARGGYLVVHGRPGVDVYCFDVRGAALTPRLVSQLDV